MLVLAKAREEAFPSVMTSGFRKWRRRALAAGGRGGGQDGGQAGGLAALPVEDETGGLGLLVEPLLARALVEQLAGDMVRVSPELADIRRRRADLRRPHFLPKG